jgi:uncharacterized protein (TIGR02001 family)
MRSKLKARMLGAAFGVAILGAGGVALADDATTGMIPGEFSGNIAISTNYIFRGVTQTDNAPSVSGGFDYSYSNFYLGTWASSLSDWAPMELDIYGGISPSYAGIDFDIGAVGYLYPSAPHGTGYDYFEAYAGASHDFKIATLGAKVFYSPDWTGSGTDSSAEYYTVTASAPLGPYFTLDGHVGWQNFGKNFGAKGVGIHDYMDWAIGLSTTVEKFDMSVQYGDTDLSTADTLSLIGHTGTDTVWFTVSRSM